MAPTLLSLLPDLASQIADEIGHLPAVLDDNSSADRDHQPFFDLLALVNIAIAEHERSNGENEF